MDHHAAARELLALAGGAQLPPARARVLEELAVLALQGQRASLRAAAPPAGVSPGTALAWSSRSPESKRISELFRIAKQGANPEETYETIRRRIEGLPDVEVPDFLTWREAHMAYLDFDGRAVRARNTWFQKDAVRRLTEHHRLLMVLPPGHLKSSLAIEYVTWNVMRNRNYRATIIQKNEAESAKLLGAIKARLQCDLYHEMARRLTEQGEQPVACPVCLFGGEHGYAPDRRDRGAMWGQHAIRVTGTTSGEKDPTVQARGVGSQIMGSRADLVLCDDVQDPMDAISSPKDSTDKLTWVQTVLLSRLYRGQKFVAVGNYVTSDDLMHQLTSTYPDWPTVAYPAILPCPDAQACPGDDACTRKEERVLAPQVWDWSSLMEKRAETGEKAWAFTWVQTDESWEGRTFRRETLDAAKSEQFRLGEIPAPVTDLFLGCDPAIAGSGVCAITALGLDIRTGVRYVCDLFAEKGLRTFDNIAFEIVEMAKSLVASHATLHAVAIEQANVQEALINNKWMRGELAALHVRIVPYKTRSGSGAQAKSDAFSITHLGTLLEEGMVKFPYGGTVKERERIDALITECLAWRVDESGRSVHHLKKDRLMSWLFAESLAFARANRPKRKPVIRDRGLPSFVERSRQSWKRDADERAFQRQLDRLDAAERARRLKERRGRGLRTLTDEEVAELRASHEEEAAGRTSA